MVTVIPRNDEILTHDEALAWLKRRKWLGERVDVNEELHRESHWAVGHIHLGVFNAWGRGKTLVDAVIDARLRLALHGRSFR